MIPPLISHALAKDHLNIIDDDHTRDIDTKVWLASYIVMNHCKLTSIPIEWTVDTVEIDSDSADMILYSNVALSPPSSYYIKVPGNIQAATLLVLSELFNNRESSTNDVISDAVVNLLAPFRDPTIA